MGDDVWLSFEILMKQEMQGWPYIASLSQALDATLLILQNFSLRHFVITASSLSSQAQPTDTEPHYVLS